jgi:hypothetical protein
MSNKILSYFFICILIVSLQYKSQSQKNAPLFRSEKDNSTTQSKPDNPSELSQDNYQSSSRKLLRQSLNDSKCYKMTVVEICIDYNYFEKFKAEKTEGKFYTFDEEKDLVHTIYHTGTGNEAITVFQSFIVKNNHLIEITIESCKTYLKYNQDQLNELLREYADYNSGCLSTQKIKKKGNQQ